MDYVAQALHGCRQLVPRGVRLTPGTGETLDFILVIYL